MPIRTVVAALLFIVFSCNARSPIDDQITAWVVDHRSMRPELDALYPASCIANNIFAPVGVKFRFRKRGGHPDTFLLERDVVIDLVDGEAKDFRAGSLGFALPYEGVHATVFYDRVGIFSARKGVPINLMLGYVLAHEITHLLEGINRHSDSGLMKASWTTQDLRGSNLLELDGEDRKLIELGLARRETGR